MVESYRNSHIKKGESYNSHFKGDAFNARVWALEKRILDRILKEYFGYRKAGNYLDFACGTGRVCSYVENMADKSIGVDVAEKMIDIARKESQKTEFRVGDITRNEVIFEEKFDLITAFRFFLNAEPELRKSALGEIRKLLNPKGIFIFNIHGNKKSCRHLPVFFKRFMGLRGNINELSFSEVENILKKYQMEIAGYYGVNFMPKFFYRLMPRKLWISCESWLEKINFLNKFATNIIYVVKINV